jgi:hypothetical protein
MNQERNQRVLQLISEGKSYGQAADEVGISRSAVAGIVHRSKPENREKNAELMRHRHLMAKKWGR